MFKQCPASSAPNCTTASWRRSIRSPSPSLTFAFLGAPRTTRQSRNFSIGAAIVAVFALRADRLRLLGDGGANRRRAALRAICAAVRHDRRQPVAHRRAASWSNRRRASIEAINRSNARLARLLRRPVARMSMIDATRSGAISPAASWSRRSACSSASSLLLVLVDYIEMVRRTSGSASASALHGRADLALPRAAAARKADAVLRPDRRDDLLSRAVAAARTGGGARRRRLGLAVRRAGARQRARARRRSATVAYNPMSADLRERSKRIEAELFGDARRRHPGRRRILDQPDRPATARPSSTPRAASSRACG